MRSSLRMNPFYTEHLFPWHKPDESTGLLYHIGIHALAAKRPVRLNLCALAGPCLPMTEVFPSDESTAPQQYIVRQECPSRHNGEDQERVG